MKEKSPYKLFPNYVLRTPLFSFSKYKYLTRNEVVDVDELKSFCRDKTFQESIFLASPELMQQIEKWLDGKIIDKDKDQRLKTTILKYISRTCARCTPYGLFAGCSVGSFSEKTDIIIDNTDNHSRHTRLDMKYLCSLLYDLILKDPIILGKLLFFPNTSIYESNNQIRYVEFDIVNNKLQYKRVCVDSNQFLMSILNKTQNGALKKDLIKGFSNNDQSIKKAAQFIDVLIKNQFLVSELEPNVSGKYYFEIIIEWLTENVPNHKVTKVLLEIKVALQQLDKNLGNTLASYRNIIELIDSLNVNYDIKHLFFVDLFPKVRLNLLSKSNKSSIHKGLFFLNKISPILTSDFFNNFKEKFHERYGGRTVDLMIAVDPEKGIGYGGKGDDINPLVDDLDLTRKTKDNSKQKLTSSPIDILLHRKIWESYKNNDNKISLCEQDINDIEISWDDLPNTISILSKIIIEDNQEKMVVEGFRSSSAANYFSRFCFSDLEMLNHVKKIVDFESEFNKDKLIAELTHLPSPRIGNVCSRPSFREYEIPYMARSTKKADFKIRVSDLKISMNETNKKILLKSNIVEKEILPRLTNYHDFTKETLPLYEFLSDMQNEGIREGLFFSYGENLKLHEFLPRVEYDNIIFHEATWNLRKSHFDEFFLLSNALLIKKVSVFRESIKLPQYAIYVEGDNKLIINFLNIDSIRMFFSIIKNKKKVQLKEFLFGDNSPIKGIGTKDYYTNEIIFSLFNSKKNQK